jgi:hypothetical protein
MISSTITLRILICTKWNVRRSRFEFRLCAPLSVRRPMMAFDDGVWEIVDRFSKFRNSFAHSATAYTADGIRKTEDQTRAVLKSLQKVRPEFTDAAATDRTWIIGWAAPDGAGFFSRNTTGLVAQCSWPIERRFRRSVRV